MAIKAFEQVYPGQNAPDLKPKASIDPREWEQKQRMKEYRIAGKREKRNRKSDEKQQRKLNATILRRMTKNPQKYTKNAGRNRVQAVEQERWNIQRSGVQMAQRLAAVYDPSGAMFNVSPVVTLEDGRVITVEALEKRQERETQKDAGENCETRSDGVHSGQGPAGEHGNVNPDRAAFINTHVQRPGSKAVHSKTQQQKRAAATVTRAPLPRPVIPEGIEIPSDEEEDWLQLWDLDNDELERRLMRAKKRAARERKKLRAMQKSGKAERRAAREEKRKVYRSIKDSWQVIRVEERRRRRFLVAMEEEERKRLAVQVSLKYRQNALDAAADLGFTLQNVEGVNEIQPKTKGMKGVEVDFDKLGYDGDRHSGLERTDEGPRKNSRGNRVDLSTLLDESQVHPVFAQPHVSGPNADALGQADFVQFSNEEVRDHDTQTLNYSHGLRRKLRRAMEEAKVQRELLVRSKAIAHCQHHGIQVPAALNLPTKPVSIKGKRTLPNGRLETDKQERTRSKIELAEFNNQVRVLRKQAKELAIEAGIRVFLELTDRIPRREEIPDPRTIAAVHEVISMAELVASWPMPEKGLGQLEGAFEDDDYSDVEVRRNARRRQEEDEEEHEEDDKDGDGDESHDNDENAVDGGTSSDDSASRQLKREVLAVGVSPTNGTSGTKKKQMQKKKQGSGKAVVAKTDSSDSSDSDSSFDSDEDMSEDS